MCQEHARDPQGWRSRVLNIRKDARRAAVLSESSSVTVDLSETGDEEVRCVESSSSNGRARAADPEGSGIPSALEVFS